MAAKLTTLLQQANIGRSTFRMGQQGAEPCDIQAVKSAIDAPTFRDQSGAIHVAYEIRTFTIPDTPENQALIELLEID